MSIVSEFKAFVSRGNVVDLAVGVVVGAAKDVITPPLGLLIGGVDFTDLKVAIGGLGKAPVTLNYGLFLQSCFNFLIISAAVFLLVKGVNALARKPASAEPPPPSAEAKLLEEIRDELRRRGPGA